MKTVGNHRKKRLCVVTATRAEYGLLKPLISRLSESLLFEVKVVVTGMHLSPEFGLTYQEIEQDNIPIHKRVEILFSGDTPSAVSKSMGMAFIGFADYFSENLFDGVILLGDRYETLAVACTAANQQIPIIHIHGGEVTEGAVDEGFRHAITKLSFLHMASTEIYRKRIVQMGEDPERVFCVGALGVENVLHTRLLPKEDLERKLDVSLPEKYALVTFHPVTLEKQSAKAQIHELMAAMGELSQWSFIVTKANADQGGRLINQAIEEYAENHENVRVYSSLGLRNYLSAMKYCSLVLGNSSSGILEAPSFHVPTVNIGDRQRGRIRAESVVDCLPCREDIVRAVKKVISPDFQKIVEKVQNPYGDGNTSEKIVRILEKELGRKELDLKKKFYDIPFDV
ncbi:MAG: UDP-N-acetylglucosamine 2-epimerase (hydrolyzing) [Lachnospiraceae bacterium]|jgi:GDP/UDP-N,N'-diacetylbacillosamine 2-epimerase (hydrolysing)|nr:UDP-N-acetylglucosamine 2-epimerase (hydrolyzing) [Lachnospiraceae bacterium]